MSTADALKTEPGERLTEDTAVLSTRVSSGTRGELDVVPGQRLGRYLILDKLGRGGMGTVFRAHDQNVDRSCALKLLHSGTAEHHALRLRREAQAMAQLSHPNIVRVYEVGQAEGRWFIAMELVEGQTLGRWQRGSHGWSERVGVYLQAGEGLAAAHRAGFVHRDFKPDNCIIDTQGRVRVLDFGLVRGSDSSFEISSSAAAACDDLPASPSLTRTGAVLGTVAYMSLEQLGGRAVDERSDQFAFCVSLYEALYGTRPFAGQSMGKLTISLMQGAVRPAPKGTAVPERVRAVVLRGLAIDPDDRWPSMDTLLDALRQQVSGRRWLRPAIAGAVGLAAIVGVVLGVGPSDEPCTGAGALMEGVWDGARKDEVEAAFKATALPYAAETWSRVEPALDHYADVWQESHTEVCRATHVSGEQTPAVMDLRMRCLQQQRVELQETVGLLAEATPTRVQRAIDLVVSLPAPSLCDDVEALQARLPPLDDPQLARAVERLREQLARVRSLAAATEFDRALEEAERIDPLAVTLDYAPLMAEARFLRGVLRADKGRYGEAEEDLEHAYFLAAEYGHDEIALEAVMTLMFVAGHERGNPERGLSWSRTAQALGRRGAENPAFEARWSIKVGILLEDQGKVEEGLAHYQRAASMQQKTRAPTADVADALRHQGGALMHLGRLDEALVHYRRALELSKEALGSGHPQIAANLNAIGIVLEEKGKLDEALEHYRRARGLWEDSLGAEHPKVAGAWANIGNVLSTQGKMEEALEHYEHVLPIWERTLGPEHPQVGQLLSNMGGLLGNIGEYSRAMECQRRSAAIIEASLGSEHPHLAQILANLGVMLWRQDQLDDATEQLERAYAIGVASLGADHMIVAQPLVILAEVALTRGDAATAQTKVKQAIAILETNDEVALERAYAYFLLARVQWPDPDQRAEARWAAQRSRTIYGGIGERGEIEVARIDAWLANDGADPPAED